jgi:hypothetical protein
MSYSDVLTNVEQKRNTTQFGNLCNEFHLVEVFKLHKHWPKDEKSRTEKKNPCLIMYSKRMKVSFQNFSL